MFSYRTFYIKESLCYILLLLAAGVGVFEGEIFKKVFFLLLFCLLLDDDGVPNDLGLRIAEAAPSSEPSCIVSNVGDNDFVNDLGRGFRGGDVMIPRFLLLLVEDLAPTGRVATVLMLVVNSDILL